MELYEQKVSDRRASLQACHDDEMQLYTKRMKQVKKIIAGDEQVTDQTDKAVVKHLTYHGRGFRDWFGRMLGVLVQPAHPKRSSPCKDLDCRVDSNQVHNGFLRIHEA